MFFIEKLRLDLMNNAAIDQCHQHLALQTASVEGGVLRFGDQVVGIDDHWRAQIAQDQIGGSA